MNKCSNPPPLCILCAFSLSVSSYLTKVTCLPENVLFRRTVQIYVRALVKLGERRKLAHQTNKNEALFLTEHQHMSFEVVYKGILKNKHI